MRRKVDFFVCGVQKGGTSALDYYLRRNRRIQMASIKEAHFFDDDEGVEWTNPDYGRLHEMFVWPTKNVIRGEATPIYSYWPNALERIYRYNSLARLIVVLRQPSFRAFSHWRMEFKRKAETLPFEQSIRSLGRERVRTAPRGVHRIFSYVERGYYSDQLAGLLKLFPREQVRFFRTDQLWAKPEIVLRGLQQFLGVKFDAVTGQQYIVPVNSYALGQLRSEERHFLDQLYRDDIHATVRLTGLDLSDWLDPAYEEPMIPHGAAPNS